MRFAFDEEQRLLAQAARDVMTRACPPSAVRAAWESDDGTAPGVWAALAESGLIGAAASEENSGLGLSPLDLILPFEESGRVALPAPFVETAAVVVPILDEVGGEAAARWLPDLIAGRAHATVASALCPCPAYFEGASVLLAERDGQLVAIDPAEVPATAEKSVDGSRRLTAVGVNDTAGRVLGGQALVEAARDRAALATSAQLLGLAQAMLDLTVDYASTRVQFGRPVGSFQAVQHRLVDALTAIEMAKPLVYRAAHAMATGAEQRSLHVSMAKATASDAANLTGRAALQIHGAIGYTIEYDLHLWMKRVWALAATWGDARWHRGRVADALLGAEGGSGPGGPTLLPAWSDE